MASYRARSFRSFLREHRAITPFLTRLTRRLHVHGWHALLSLMFHPHARAKPVPHRHRYAVTVHRVQGATLEQDVHVLLNSEFFADGQAVSHILDPTPCPPLPFAHDKKPARVTTRQYVALSRCRSLEQLHLWGLDRNAIRADANVSREYKKLAARRLTRTRLEAAPSRTTPRLPAFSRLPSMS